MAMVGEHPYGRMARSFYRTMGLQDVCCVATDLDRCARTVVEVEVTQHVQCTRKTDARQVWIDAPYIARSSDPGDVTSLRLRPPTLMGRNEPGDVATTNKLNRL